MSRTSNLLHLRFPNFKISPLFLAAATAVALAACASAPTTNPQLTRIESDLRAAYSDKYIAQYGQADLAQAETALTAARKSMRSRDREEMQHELTMAEGYVNLGEIHGQQERVKADIAALKVSQDQIRLEARDRQINRANDAASASRADAAFANQQAMNQAESSRLETAAALLATQNAELATQQAALATQTADQKLAAMREQLRDYDMKMTELGATLVLRDVMFETNSSQLRSGAVNRLNPLINYLKSSPETAIRVEGHTDSTGSDLHNDGLSLERASAVARALQANGTLSNSIQSFGFGETKPIASNDTVSGREQNRRVEITLLQ